MKDKRFLFGLLVTALALSLTAVGCEVDIPRYKGQEVKPRNY